MNSFIRRAVGNSMEDMQIGLLQSIGGDLLRREPDGTVVSSLFGFEVPVKPGVGIGKGSYTGAGGKLGMGLGAAALGGTVWDAYHGYQDRGLVGAGRAIALNVALNAALAKHGHTIENIAGVATYNPGRFITATQLAKLGKVGKVAGNAANLTDFLLRGLWGSAIGEGVAGALGGGLFSTPFGMAGSSIGARIGLRGTVAMMGVGAVVGTGYLAAKAGASVLKAGYRHTQTKKMINTDGDMSSFMTQNAFTQRARAVAAISKSHMNARSALGQEASFLSMPSRNYHSNYRM
jgi:hypothetical protein